MHDLDRDLALVTEILGQKHRGHAAGTQLLLEQVPVGYG